MRWNQPIRHVVLSVAFAIVLFSQRQVLGDDSSLKDRVLSEYPNALKRLENAFSHQESKGISYTCQVITSESAESRSFPKMQIDGQEYAILAHKTQVMYINENLVKCESFKPDDPFFEGFTKPGEAERRRTRFPAERVWCIGPRYCFRLVKRDKEGALTLDNFAPGTSGQQEYENTAFTEVKTKVYSPVAIEGTLISSLMADPGFAIKAVSAVRSTGHDCLRIEFNRDAGKTSPSDKAGSDRKNDNPLIYGWIVVSPGEAWVLREFETKYRSGHRRSGVVEYGSTQDGIPLPTRLVSFLKRPNGDPFYCYSFDFERVVLGPIPESQFTLSAYGLPELEEPSRRRGDSTGYMFFGLAIAALVASISLWHFGRQSRRRAEPSPPVP